MLRPVIDSSYKVRVNTRDELRDSILRCCLDYTNSPIPDAGAFLLFSPPFFNDITNMDPNSSSLKHNLHKLFVGLIINEITSLDMFTAFVATVFNMALKSVEYQAIFVDVFRLLCDKAYEWSQKYTRVMKLNEKQAPAGAGWYFDVSGGSSVQDGKWLGPYTTRDEAQDEGYRISNFQRLLLYQCQREFFRDYSLQTGQEEELDEAQKAARGGSMTAAEIEEFRVRALRRKDLRMPNKMRMLSNIAFIGRLYNAGILTSPILFSCCGKLLNAGKPITTVPNPDDIEALCKLLTLAGRKLEEEEKNKLKEKPDAEMKMVKTFELLQRTIDAHPKLESRSRFLVKDLIDLRSNKWERTEKDNEDKEDNNNNDELYDEDDHEDDYDDKEEEDNDEEEEVKMPLRYEKLDDEEDALSTVRARVKALSVDLERIDFTNHAVEKCSEPGPVKIALAAMQAPARLNILKIEATKAFFEWQDKAKFVESLSANDKVSLEKLDAAIIARNTAAIDASTRITSAAESARIALQFDAATTTKTITAATEELNQLVRDYERLFGSQSLRDARFSGTIDDAMIIFVETANSGRINDIVLDQCTYVELEKSVKTDSRLPARVSALNTLIALAREALASLTPNITAADQRELVVQDSECLSRQLALVIHSQDLSAECSRLRALWPEKEKAEITAKKTHLQAKRVIEDAEADGEVPTQEAVDRLEERLRKKTEAVGVNESLRAQVRTLVADGCPEARYLLSIMTPRAPTAVHATDFDKMWAELLEAGVASSFRREDFTDIEALPHSSGRVFRARLHNTEERTVLKEFSKAPGATDLKLFMNEVRLLQKLRHPNILALHSVLADKGHVYLRLPWVEGGSMREWLLTKSRSPFACVRTFAGVAAALAYIHASGVVHRDLKPENILIGGDGVPRLCDFGISLSSASNTTILHASGAGTEAYKSPEQLKGERATFMSDQYALGLVLHELVFNKPYNASIEQRRDHNDVILPKTNPLDWPEPLVDAARLLLRRLLSTLPYERPSANAVLADPFCDRASDLATTTTVAARATNAAAATINDVVINVRRQLAATIAKVTRRPTSEVHVLPASAALFSVFTTAMQASCAESTDASILWRIALSLEGGGDVERALDAALAASMRSDLGLFVTSSDEGAGPVLPAVPRSGVYAGTHADGLFAVGAALAQAALQGCFELDALGRLPEIAFYCLAHGPDEFLRKHFSTLPQALASLGQFDEDKARIFRELLQGAAEDYGIEAKNWLGTPEVVTDANKFDLVRRECEDICVRKRLDAWKHLHRGWVAGGGGAVVEECKKAGLESVRPLVYDPAATQRRRAQVAASADLTPEQRAALNIKRCPHCGFPVQKIEGCDQMVCGRDAHGVARFDGGCGRAFKWSEARS